MEAERFNHGNGGGQWKENAVPFPLFSHDPVGIKTHNIFDYKLIGLLRVGINSFVEQICPPVV